MKKILHAKLLGLLFLLVSGAAWGQAAVNDQALGNREEGVDGSFEQVEYHGIRGLLCSQEVDPDQGVAQLVPREGLHRWRLLHQKNSLRLLSFDCWVIVKVAGPLCPVQVETSDAQSRHPILALSYV